MLAGDLEGLAAAEPEILKEMNEARPDAIGDFAERLPGRPGNGWRLAGIDPEGLDLRSGGETARLDFRRARVHPRGGARSACRARPKGPGIRLR